MTRSAPGCTLFPYTTPSDLLRAAGLCHSDLSVIDGSIPYPTPVVLGHEGAGVVEAVGANVTAVSEGDAVDRKSTRLNSSHTVISYAVFCLKKENGKKRLSKA